MQKIEKKKLFLRYLLNFNTLLVVKVSHCLLTIWMRSSINIFSQKKWIFEDIYTRESHKKFYFLPYKYSLKWTFMFLNIKQYKKYKTYDQTHVRTTYRLGNVKNLCTIRLFT